MARVVAKKTINIGSFCLILPIRGLSYQIFLEKVKKIMGREEKPLHKRYFSYNIFPKIESTN
jgi:hypothetical protein